MLSKFHTENRLQRLVGFIVSVVLFAGIFLTFNPRTQLPALAQNSCNAPFTSISEPLNDLGTNEYIHPTQGSTGVIGGLYPGGNNNRPSSHENAGISLANQITPLNTNGQPDPNGKIVMISIGMSNSFQEFGEFVTAASNDPAVNPQLTIVNTAQPGMASDEWVTLPPPNPPNNDNAWTRVMLILDNQHGIPPEQVQIIWVKLAQRGFGSFPAKAQSLQADLEIISRHAKTLFPNVKLAYYTSRTRAYDYAWDDGPHLSPEPDAFETGFSVRWLIEKQINGDPNLNYDPNNGTVVAPYLSWGPYIWADGTNPRSDGLVWTLNDVAFDCVHPSDQGKQKIATLLLNFFKNDSTTSPWFLADGFPTATPVTNTPTSQTPTATSSAPTATSNSPHTRTPTPFPTNTPSPTPIILPPNAETIYLPAIQTK